MAPQRKVGSKKPSRAPRSRATARIGPAPSPRPGGGADIWAVAERAGVSISTVSRCLTGKRKLAPEVEARIRAAATALRYSPNHIARSLRVRRTQVLGMIIPDSRNPFFSDMIKGAEDGARAAGYSLMLWNSDESRAREHEHLATMASMRCDGALVIPAPGAADDRERARSLAASPVPIVFLGRSPGIDCDLVLADNLGISREAVTHLVRLGHRRIAVVTVAHEVSTQVDRVRGYERALAEAGLEPRREYEVRAPALTVADGFAATSRLLDLKTPPTAIFATSNSLSIGAVAAIESRGLRCPDNVSVVGYDSYPWQDVFHPRLTTIKQPAYDIGQRAAQLLIDRLAGKRAGGHEKVELQASLVVRESSAPPARSRG